MKLARSTSALKQELTSSSKICAGEWPRFRKNAKGKKKNCMANRVMLINSSQLTKLQSMKSFQAASCLKSSTIIIHKICSLVVKSKFR